MQLHGPAARRLEKVGREALIIGGSMAGLTAARVLSRYFERVTILERDRYPDGPLTRKGLPQARHVHVLLMRGLAILEELFPGLGEEMTGAGAIRLDTASDLAWLTPYGWGKRFHSGLVKLAFSRDLLDWIVRKRLRRTTGVEFRENSEVTGLLRGEDPERVCGLRVRGRGASKGTQADWLADLVVDASGRSSRTPGWLTEAGWESPRETTVNAFLGYASRLYRAPQGSDPDWKAVFIQAAPPQSVRAGVLFPIEGNRWLVTLAGAERDYPPEDEFGYREFAGSLPSSLIHDFISRAEPLSDAVGYRSTENRRRHYEELAVFPANLIVLGDAACCFNPVYGQGITTAALEALQLRASLDRQLRSRRRVNLARDFHRRLAKTIETPWMMATSEDCRYPKSEGGRIGRGTRWMHAYTDRVVEMTVQDERIRRTWLQVFHMLKPPTTLFRPGVFGPVLLAVIKDVARSVWRRVPKFENPPVRASKGRPGATGQPRRSAPEKS